jgi:uncharacterized protein (DUF2342 family)
MVRFEKRFDLVEMWKRDRAERSNRQKLISHIVQVVAGNNYLDQGGGLFEHVIAE